MHVMVTIPAAVKEKAEISIGAYGQPSYCRPLEMVLDNDGG
jgi:hypothetical protein